MSFRIVFISILLKLSFPAILNIVGIVDSALPFNLLMWSSLVHLLLIVVPRYLYVAMFSRSICPKLNGVSGVFHIVIVWLFSCPICYFIQIRYV